MIWTPARRPLIDGWSPQTTRRRTRFDLRSLMGVFTFGGKVVTKDGKVATSENCCCTYGQKCGACRQCVRGAWVTFPSLTADTTAGYLCECGCYAGTYYIPIGIGRYCVPSSTVPQSCNVAIAALGSSGTCPFAMPDGSYPSWSCTGCWEEFFAEYPGCDDHICGECTIIDGDLPGPYLSGEFSWGVRTKKIAGVWVVQSFIYLLAFNHASVWTKTVTTTESGSDVDCAVAEGAHTLACTTGVCQTASTASLDLDFGPCPA